MKKRRCFFLFHLKQTGIAGRYLHVSPGEVRLNHLLPRRATAEIRGGRPRHRARVDPAETRRWVEEARNDVV